MNIKSVLIPVDHPAFNGHFPGTPILPGVSLLELVIDSCNLPIKGITSAKFLSPVMPGDLLIIATEILNNSVLSFTVRRSNQVVCEGKLIPGNSNG